MTAKGTVLNMKRDGYPADAVCIDRGTAYGNPFVIGVHGKTRNDVCDLHLVWARAKAAENPAWLEYLRGKDMVCHCKPKRCHGDNYMILLYGDDA